MYRVTICACFYNLCYSRFCWMVDVTYAHPQILQQNINLPHLLYLLETLQKYLLASNILPNSQFFTIPLPGEVILQSSSLDNHHYISASYIAQYSLTLRTHLSLTVSNSSYTIAIFNFTSTISTSMCQSVFTAYKLNSTTPPWSLNYEIANGSD